jgi:hypothetical protein
MLAQHGPVPEIFNTFDPGAGIAQSDTRSDVAAKSKRLIADPYVHVRH